VKVPPSPFKEPLGAELRGFAPAPHSLFEKSEPKTFIEKWNFEKIPFL